MKYIKTYEKIREKIMVPTVNSIVWYDGSFYKVDENYPCDVYIISGDFYSNDRISNFWHWKRVLPDGTLSEEESGYGGFYESPVVPYKVYTEEEIKEIYPEKYEKYLMRRDANKYNV